MRVTLPTYNGTKATRLFRLLVAACSIPALAALSCVPYDPARNDVAQPQVAQISPVSPSAQANVTTVAAAPSTVVSSTAAAATQPIVVSAETVTVDGTSLGPGTAPNVAAIESGVVQMLQAACEKGNLESCTGLGALYWKGSMVPQDKARGQKLLQKACAGGDANACRVQSALMKEGTP